MAQSTSEYYKSNSAARKRRVKQQDRYNKTPKGKLLIKNAQALNKKLGGKKGDGLDASHTGPNTGKLESPKTNRTRPRKGKRFA
jgi:hypothetical protein